MKALSVYQPWCWAMFEPPPDAWKDIENRKWEAPWVKGKFIAIHAAKTLDDMDAWFAIETASRGHRPPGPTELDVGGPVLVRGAIVGVVQVLDFVRSSSSPWFGGPVGWVLGRRYKLPSPVVVARCRFKRDNVKEYCAGTGLPGSPCPRCSMNLIGDGGGAQGLWDVPPDAELVVRAGVEQARRALAPSTAAERES
jgi:hypothetical protein